MRQRVVNIAEFTAVFSIAFCIGSAYMLCRKRSLQIDCAWKLCVMDQCALVVWQCLHWCTRTLDSLHVSTTLARQWPTSPESMSTSTVKRSSTYAHLMRPAALHFLITCLVLHHWTALLKLKPEIRLIGSGNKQPVIENLKLFQRIWRRL